MANLFQSKMYMQAQEDEMREDFKSVADETIERISRHRSKILEEFSQAYLASLLPEGFTKEEAYKKISEVELCEVMSTGRDYYVRWFFREKQPISTAG